MQTVKVQSLVLDYSLYPRTKLDGVNVSDLAEAIKAGTPLPPIVVDSKTMRVVDGFHRVTAIIRLKVEEIPVEYRNYSSDADLYLDAVVLNAHHGRRLGRLDHLRILDTAKTLSISTGRIASALGLTADRLESIRELRTAHDPSGRPVALRAAVAHFAGRALTARQVEVNERLGGNSAFFWASRLADVVENNLVNWQDERLVNALNRLEKVLQAVSVHRDRSDRDGRAERSAS
jgi:ParB-like chromosome segregation protein Spo0J